MNIFQEAKQILDKDGKVNPLGPYGKGKLTGREVSTYFRRNKVKDAQIKKAVEVALDLGGAHSIASQEIRKFYGDKIYKSKEVQSALKYANESRQPGMHVEIINEKFKPDNIKSRKTGKKLVAFDAYIQFRGGKGDRITSPENKKDWEKAIKLVQMWLRKHKIKRDINGLFSNPDEGSSAYKLSISLNDKEFEKSPDALDDLVNQISKLKTAEDHGGGHREHPMNEETINERMKLAQIVRKHKAALMKAKKSGSLELPQKVEDDLSNWAANSGDIHGDDPDEFIDWLDNNIDDLVPTLKIKEETISEEMITYRVKKMQKPELDKFQKSAKMMKLKVKFDQGFPRMRALSNHTVLIVSGTKKNLRDFDAVVRGKSSYGDPSAVKHFDESNLMDTYRQRHLDMQEASAAGQIDKLFNLKGNKEAGYGVAKLLNMTGVKVAQQMQKQNSKGFMKTMIALGKEKGKMQIPTNNALMKMFKQQGVKPLPENYRKLARKGMGAETRKSIKVGTIVDFYDNNGNKREGKIIKVGQIGDGYTLKDTKDNKLYKFKFHDRMKAKKLLAASIEENINEQTVGGYGYRSGERDSNRDARVADWKKKKSEETKIEALQKKLESARKQRQVHDDAASEYREKASKVRERNPDDRAADGYDEKADKQEDMAMNQNHKVQDLKDAIKDAKGIKDSYSPDPMKLMVEAHDYLKNICETKKQEVDAMKKISKDMQKVLKAYQKVSTMGDKTLKDTKHNPSYKKVLDARDAVITMIGTLNTQMLLTKEENIHEFNTKMPDKVKDQLIDLFNKGMDVKHNSPEHKAIKKQIDKISAKYSMNKENNLMNAYRDMNTIDEGMLNIDKARQLDKKIQDLILKAKEDYDRTWSGVFVPMGDEGTSQRKEYQRRGDVFKQASKRYKALLMKYKVMNK